MQDSCAHIFPEGFPQERRSGPSAYFRPAVRPYISASSPTACALMSWTRRTVTPSSSATASCAAFSKQVRRSTCSCLGSSREIREGSPGPPAGRQTALHTGRSLPWGYKWFSYCSAPFLDFRRETFPRPLIRCGAFPCARPRSIPVPEGLPVPRSSASLHRRAAARVRP